MNEHNQSARNESNPSESSSRQKHRARRWMLAGMTAVMVGAFSVAGLSHAEGGPGFHGRHHFGMQDGQADPAAAEKHLNRMVTRLVPDATPEQKTQLAAIAKAAFADLKPLRAQHRAGRQQGITLLSQATIDTAALEQLRVSQVQLDDQISKRITRALTEAANVLNPTQRATVAEKLNKRMGKH